MYINIFSYLVRNNTAKIKVIVLILIWEFRQARNQGFFRVGEVSQNKGTSVKIKSASYKRKRPQGKISEFFFLDTLKTAF